MDEVVPEQVTAQGTEPNNYIKTSNNSRYKKVFVILIIIILSAVLGGTVVYFANKAPSHASISDTSHNNKASLQSPSNAPTQSIPTMSFSNVLVFQPTQGQTSIVNLDGTVTHNSTVDTNSDSYIASGYSQENIELIEGSALITTDKAWSNYAVLTPDGKVTPVNVSLNTLLSSNAHPSNTNLSDVILPDANTLLAMKNTTGDTSVQFVKVNLQSGEVTTLLTAQSTKTQRGYGYIMMPYSLSKDNTSVYLLSDEVNLNNTPAPGISLVSYNLESGKYTVTPLPKEVDLSAASVSNDGELVAYDTYGANNGYQAVTTHIYNVKTRTDVVVPTEGVAIAGGSRYIKFSPDAAYVSAVGHYAADTKQAGMGLQIISTKTNNVVQHVDMIGVQYQIQDFG